MKLLMIDKLIKQGKVFLLQYQETNFNIIYIEMFSELIKSIILSVKIYRGSMVYVLWR